MLGTRHSQPPCSPGSRTATLVIAIVGLVHPFRDPASATGLADEVDLRIGVRTESCVVGPSLPHGSVHPSPETLDEEAHRPGNDGYHPDAPIIGFTQLHAQGTGGRASYGQILLSPQVDGLETEQSLHASPKSDEVVTVSYYAATLDRYGVRCEVVPTRHGALYRFTYPPGAEPTLVINTGRKIGGPSLVRGDIAVSLDAREVWGSGYYVGNWSGAAFDLHHVIRVSQPIASAGTFHESQVFPDSLTNRVDGVLPTDRFGAVLRFDPDGPRTIEVRIAVSFHSVERARQWLADEIDGRDIGELRAVADSSWNAELGRILITGGTDDARRIFYTSLARCFTQPRNRTGDVAGIDPAAPFWDDHYTLWDTYRCFWPLLTLIAPERVAQVLRGFHTTFERFGRVGTASVGTEMLPAEHQGGTEVDDVLGDAFVKKLEEVDWESLYEIVRHDADEERPGSYVSLGFVPFPISTGISASATLAFALNDYCAFRMASGLGHSADAARFGARAISWRNLWDASATRDGFSGFVRPRDAAGTFHGDVDSQDGFYEASSWSYTLAVPHDVRELIERCGGPERFNDRLMVGYETARVHFRNEPDFFVPWLHVYAGRPDLTAERVHELIDAYTTERYPGQEDAGAHASRFVFAAMGLYPNAGQPIYLLHGPLFDRMRVRVGDGRELVIERVATAESARYVQSVTLNGEPLDRAWILHDEIAGGGVLTFEMGDMPSDWGRATPPPAGLEEVPDYVAPVPPVLLRVFPMPFRDIVILKLARVTPGETYSLRIFDASGRLVAVLAENRTAEVGLTHTWDGRRTDGGVVGAGVYVYRLTTTASARTQTGRLVHLTR